MPLDAATQTADALHRQGFRPGAAVEYAKGPTVTNGVLGGTWVPGTFVGLVPGAAGIDPWYADIQLADGQTLRVSMAVVRLAS